MGRSLRSRLLAWYDANRRDLPWRETRDPYAIWVSEIMLQQTRVETVIPYYERFLARFPTPEALAAASEDELMSRWSGLGYYRRARLLQAGAREVVERYGGEVPEDPQARRDLPGVGRYTAGAIGSIAFDRPEPIVDGNVARVLSRLRLVDTPLGKAATDRALWAEAEALVDGPRPGDLNQGLMELGATVCTPTSPRCDECPWRADCRALAEGRVDELPVPRKKKPPREVSLAAVVAHPGGDPERVWLVRGKDRLFGGLWGLPTQPAIEADRETAEGALQGAGLRGRLARRPAGRVVHVLSHRRLTVDVWVSREASGEPDEDRRWVALDALSELGVSRLTRKLLAAAAG